MKVSEREKKILFILLITIIFVFSYNFGYVPMKEKKDRLDKEVMDLNIRLTELLQKQSTKTKVLKEIDELEVEIERYNNLFPTSITQEEAILFVHNIEKRFDVIMNQVSISEPIVFYQENMNNTQQDTTPTEGEQQVKEQEPTGEVGTKIQLGISFECGYNSFKELLAYIRDYERRVVIDNVTISVNPEMSKLSGNITISLYAITSEQEVTNKNLEIPVPVGDNKIVIPFIKAVNSNSSTTINDTSNQYSSDYDFFVMLSPVTSDVSATIIGKNNDREKVSFIYSDNSNVENITIEFTQKGSDYYIRYKTKDRSYPSGYDTPVKFDPGDRLDLRIISSSRVSESDTSGVNATIINKTDKTLNITIRGEDKNRKRFNIVSQEGNIRIQ